MQREATSLRLISQTSLTRDPDPRTLIPGDKAYPGEQCLNNVRAEGPIPVRETANRQGSGVPGQTTKKLPPGKAPEHGAAEHVSPIK